MTSSPAPLAPRSVLIADHRGAGLAQLAAPLGRGGFVLTACDSVSATRAALSQDAFQLVILDPLAPGGSTEVELVARTGPQAPRPLLLVVEAGPPPPAALSRSLRGVPCDLIRRDASVEEYMLRIERLFDQAALFGELRRVRYEAHHDDRTGLLRPNPFQQRIREHFSAAQRHGLPLALVLIDLDRFGQVNKQFDHTVGDELIARSGSVIQRCLRAEDVGARLGGDEFAVALPYTQPVDAARVVQRLLGELHGLSGPVRAGEAGMRPLAVSASIGFDTFDGRDLESPEVLRRRAETALREAKVRGGNNAVYYRSLAPPAGPTGLSADEQRA
ncbi:MAG: GGDEF domain-containing protein [Planctomycetota bacterium]